MLSDCVFKKGISSDGVAYIPSRGSFFSGWVPKVSLHWTELCYSRARE